MNNKRVLTFACTSLLLGSTVSLPVYADQDKAAAMQTSQSASTDDSAQLERQATDAWREGKLDTIYLFNRHLNNFTIDPEVKGSTVILTGKVESDVDKELAEQLARGIDGISDVTNELTVVPSDQARTTMKDGERSFSDKVEDATLTAEVKTKLLANGETSGLSIHVDTVARTVTLTGDVKSAAEKDLAEVIAKQVDGVMDVNNSLQVKS